MVKSFSGIRKNELSSLISSIRSMRGSTLNTTEKVFKFTNSITCRSAFGKICKDRDEFITLVEGSTVLCWRI
ncbi:hypothetical protein P3L10_018833 [Capsicum annuum]